MFNKILIANRGEIACRVIATCRRLGIATVAVYSDADRNARHVRLADEAIHIGAAPAAESYLRAEVILEAARRSGAQAIHPGYGFLSENAGFARACDAAGIVFIGPPASAIDAMGDKSSAKALMQTANVPLTPGYHGERQEPEFLRAQADAIGYPVLIKASAGGGGKGMRKVEASTDFEAALASCQREAQAAFGNAHVLVEKYVERPRHIEIQVFGDSHGNVVYLFERDCSVQRRHQKVLEEAPAPGMTPERRAAMGKAATDAARAVGYVGAGTVEFIAGPDGDFYFMEMNTRLQVEHPVTELITGTDLVEWQLRVAAGQPLPKAQQQLQICGHAIEARLYAEDADRGFLPSTGTLRHLRLPQPSANVRIDAGVEQGDAITPYYDPMIAKLIVWDADRDRALQRMQHALAQCQVVGVTTNAAFLRRLVMTGSFQHANLDTALIEREHAALDIQHSAATVADWALAAVLACNDAAAATNDTSPWAINDGWRITGPAARSLLVEHLQQQQTLQVRRQPDGWQVQVGDALVHVIGRVHGNGYALQVGDRLYRGNVLRDGNVLHVLGEERQQRFIVHDPVTEADSAGDPGGSLLAPMPGRVVTLLVEPGSTVSRGTPLLVMEAMKMEHTLQAPSNGTVHGFRAKAGDQVGDGAVLVDFEAG
ncbi:3-methylcrotonyl-CoA carboxylase [Stenotrophomonas pictorum JCM 9942]|uniref:Biotin carboxylase n=1 Tax=Stenotrophomonas pictorum JCM 9942 TaxID=1236960 RepID=A0A0R0AWP2_9GAMM|nr:acetyl/propionyl/methylcrotonyl-CoA carboxylase subunit alpha [Stenotrophomonas pictorum]KRG45144.1 3-methylcrotonyl-CoA carboxylase [Stenotrophomonas pictorum JCM 9942]